jgi:hypothetical protein
MMYPLPTLASSWGQPKEVCRHCALPLQLPRQPEQRLAQEHRPRYHQDWRYLGGADTSAGVDSQTLATAFDYP